MGRTIKRLSGLEIDEVSLVDRPANQHGVVAIAKRQEDVMGIYDAEGTEVSEEELEHGDFVYDDQGNEFVFVEDGVDEEALDNELQMVGKGAGSAATRFKTAAEYADAKKAKSIKSRFKAAKDSANGGPDWFKSGSARAGNAVGGAVGAAQHAGEQAGAHVGRHKLAYGGGAAGATAVAGGGAIGAHQMRKSLGDSVMESLSKSFTDDDRNEVIAKAMDYVDEISKRNEYLEDAVASILEDRDVTGYVELAKSYDLPVDPEEIAGIMYRASQSLPEGDVATLDRLFSSMGEVNKAYYDEIGYSGSYEGSALSEVFAAAGEVVSKSGTAMSQEQAVTALFDANPAAYDEYEAEQRYNR
jgi:hypothetical protein